VISFSRLTLGRRCHPTRFLDSFQRSFVRPAFQKYAFHDLRHSCASLLLSLGVPAKLVQETLRHSTYQLTMDTYSHMIPALRDEVASRMDEIFPTAVNEAVNFPAAIVN
jgi:integrase